MSTLNACAAGFQIARRMAACAAVSRRTGRDQFRLQASVLQHCHHATPSRTIATLAPPGNAMQPQERLAFSAIDTRPPLQLPDGLRLILWPLLSLEQWAIA